MPARPLGGSMVMTCKYVRTCAAVAAINVWFKAAAGSLTAPKRQSGEKNKSGALPFSHCFLTMAFLSQIGEVCIASSQA